MPTSSSSPPIAPRKSSPAVAIAGGAVGGIAGIVILCLLIWFLKRRRSRDLSKMNEKYSSFNLVKTSNQTIPQPFTAQNGGSSSVSASSSTGYLVTSDVPVIGYGVSINKNAAFQQRFITSGPSSATPSSSINPSASDFASSPARPPQPRDIDVGPVVLEDQNEGMLPPAYGQFFANLNSTVPPESSTSTVP
ncbi:hypothetical protein BDQ17DRAFT_1374685 [Cyathus striatus]|nr:hypothetical protein BDQ17DRAFT_1374685 [Cyathus striatus]